MELESEVIHRRAPPQIRHPSHYPGAEYTQEKTLPSYGINSLGKHFEK